MNINIVLNENLSSTEILDEIIYQLKEQNREFKLPASGLICSKGKQVFEGDTLRHNTGESTMLIAYDNSIAGFNGYIYHKDEYICDVSGKELVSYLKNFYKPC